MLSVAMALVLALSMAAGVWVTRRQHRIAAAAGRFSQLDMSRRVSRWMSQRGWQQAAARRLKVGEAAALALAAGLALPMHAGSRPEPHDGGASESAH